MQTKQEKLTNLKVKLKEIGNLILISFFFAAFIIFIFSLTFKKQIDNYLSLINVMAVDVTTSTNSDVKIDTETKKIIKYPVYGEVYALLKIPSIHLEYPVYHGDTPDLLMKGIGHYAESFFPGEGGSIILAGHNNVHFQNLYDVKKKDLITLETIYGTFTYKVYDSKVISSKDEDALPIENNEEILMIYTCYPKTAMGHTNKRFGVYSKLGEADYDKVKAN